ncbi:Anaphase-promoting complex, cyclosome, subunit 3 [Planctomycetes bacterium MalM25]|nr:Anaphase-promoting complex, cyclosome, subunit 3 [Planctomycetes bacterium MalM25]
MAELEDDEPQSDAPSGGLLGKLRSWAEGGKNRNLIVGVAFGLVTIGMVAMWMTAAEIAAGPEEPAVVRALKALDAGEDEEARSIIAELQDAETLTAEDYGGGLYVLGALKVNDAERQWSPDRSRTDYFVASKYLEEAKAIGFPEGREADGLYLLGKSLIESRQLKEGITNLRRAIAAGAHGEARAHLLLAEAFFFAPEPNFESTIREIDLAIADPEIGPGERSEALLLRAEALASLDRGEEALKIAQEAGGASDPARRALVEGKALVAQLESTAGSAAGTLAQQATEAIDRARRADKLATSITREGDYLKARVAQLTGQTDEALLAFDNLRRGYGASPAGIAAALAEAEIYQSEGKDEDALIAFRRVFDAIGDPATYRSSIVPLNALKLRVKAAHKEFISEGNHGAALELSDRVGRLLGITEKLEMRAETLRRWGEAEIARGEHEGREGLSRIHAGRQRLRRAGIAYERLAEARYATRQFTDDLWTAAEALQAGQAYGEAIRVLQRYLRNEPVQRNALALLRLGEAHLARAQIGPAIDNFEECLEFHANDASSFQARLECAKAYGAKGDYEKAEELLRHNLTRTALTPRSPEWRDSKFELGRLLTEAGRHEEAIYELEEAVGRYRDAPQTRDDPKVRHEVLTSEYLVAMAHREAAAEPLGRLKEANTVNERETAREQANEHLQAALKMYKSVQTQITLANSGDERDRVTLRNCFMLAGDVLFELGRYEEARQSFSNISTLYQNEPYMLEALVQIYHCWRRQGDQPKARGVIQQAQQLLARLPSDADFATSTNLSRTEWGRLLTRLSDF